MAELFVDSKSSKLQQAMPPNNCSQGTPWKSLMYSKIGYPVLVVPVHFNVTVQQKQRNRTVSDEVQLSDILQKHSGKVLESRFPG